MKLLFSADWHIKLGQKNVPKEWQTNRFRSLFDKLTELKVDMHVVGGDIFDDVPSIEELALFFEFVVKTKVPTIIYDGNHEASKKGQSFLPLLNTAVSSANSNVTILKGPTSIDNIDFIPYTHIHNFNPEDCDGDILCTHVRGSIPPHVQPEIDLTKLDRWRTVLAGDLHSYENSQRNILYPGSPMTVTFHRKEVKNGVIIIDTKTHDHEWIYLKLPQLIRKTVSSEKEIVKTEYHHTIYEIVGNVVDLSNITTDNELFDKKIIEKESKSTLELENKSIKEELQIYLKNILKLSDKNIQEILSVYENYARKIGVE